MSSTSDFGSDVKRLCSVLMQGYWDLWLPHLLNCTLVEAFGTAAGSQSSKNPAVRSWLKDVKRVKEHLNKSSSMRSEFEDLQSASGGRPLRLLQCVSHRWLSTLRMIERFRKLWEALVTHYERNEVKVFPLAGEQTFLLQLFYLMLTVSEIIAKSQGTS